MKDGDPLAIAIYGLATLLIIKLVNDNSPTQKWYADDGNAVGKLKSQLIVNDQKYNEAIKVFKNTEVEMKKGARVLDSVIGSKTERKSFLETQLEEHNKTLKKLGKIARTSPQKVYSCYTKRIHKEIYCS